MLVGQCISIYKNMKLIYLHTQILCIYKITSMFIVFFIYAKFPLLLQLCNLIGGHLMESQWNFYVKWLLNKSLVGLLLLYIYFWNWSEIFFSSFSDLIDQDFSSLCGHLHPVEPFLNACLPSKILFQLIWEEAP